MSRLIVSMHTSLDGFVAGPNGEMDWIKLDDAMFDLIGRFTTEADTALYGRVTYQMMESYWPTAANKPNASKHDLEHSLWYNMVQKVVISRTIQESTNGMTTVIRENVPEEVQKLKEKEGKNIIIFGSPSVVRTLMEHNLIDDYWLFVNPIILGNGIPFFANFNDRIKLKQAFTQSFSTGVTGLHYQKL